MKKVVYKKSDPSNSYIFHTSGAFSNLFKYSFNLNNCNLWVEYVNCKSLIELNYRFNVIEDRGFIQLL